MARTTDELVGGIIKVKSSIPLTPFIEAANILVTQCCVDGLSDDLTAYTADQLLKIETWLAAHFYSVRDMVTESERADVVSRKFQSKVDLGFNTSHYGQQAMRLDFYGGLAALNEDILKGRRRRISATWLGTEDPTDTLSSI
jgi:hypothetical protein